MIQSNYQRIILLWPIQNSRSRSAIVCVCVCFAGRRKDSNVVNCHLLSMTFYMSL